MMQDIIQWDVATWKRGLAVWDRHTRDLEGKCGLELGSRDGGMSLFLALKGCHMVCSDLGGPSEHAADIHRRHGVSELVTYECIDAKQIPYPSEHFDVVILKSVLGALGSEEHGLDPQRTAVSEIHRVLRPGGVFLLAENMRGSILHVLLRRHFVPWGRRWCYFTPAQIAELLSGFAEVELSFYGFAASLGRSEWQRRLLHSFDRVLVPLLPNALRYVVFGFARK